MLYYRLHLNIVSQVVWFFFSLSYGVEGGISRDWLKKKKKKLRGRESERETGTNKHGEKQLTQKFYLYLILFFLTISSSNE